MLSTQRRARRSWFIVLAFLAASSGCTTDVSEDQSVSVVRQQLPAGVAVWLRADGNVYSSGTTQAADGATVATWVDSSARANNATQASATARPTFTSVAVNYNPAIRFARDATDSTFLDTGAMGIAGTGGSTHILVVRQTAITAPGAIGDAFGDFIVDRPTATSELTSFKVITVAGQNRIAYQKRTNAGANISGPTATTAPALGTWRIIQYERNRGVAYNLYFEGRLESTVPDLDGDTTPPPMRIGRHATNGGGGFTGDVAEVLAFSNALSVADRRQVQSFLALKYGITLDQSTVLLNDGTGDYVDSSGTVIFDAHSGTAVNAYNKAIAGIGRDTTNSLAQKQSSGAGDVIAIGLDAIAASNAANTATIATDRTFLVWGHDGAALTRTQTGAPSARVRVARIWRATETGGDLTDVDVAWNTSSLSLPPTTAVDYRLLLDASDTDFADATSVTASDFAGGVATFATVDIDDGAFFTFGLVDTDSDGTSDPEEDSNADGNRSNDDADSDGTPNFQDPGNADPCLPNADVLACLTGDFDGDGIRNTVECPILVACPDSDGDGDADYQDTDSDGDGLQDMAECTDDSACEDGDVDGLSDYIESDTLDTDADDDADAADADSDGDGSDDGDECSSLPCADTDTDGIPDSVDAADAGPGSGDSDLDGRLDDIECSSGYLCPDSDGDQVPDYMDTDSDADGTDDDTDAAPLDPCLPMANTAACATGDVDGDGEPNGTDPGPSDPCNPHADALTCPSGDPDDDGIGNAVECPNGVLCPDSDADGMLDYLDTDSDGDGDLDAAECPDDASCADADADGLPDFVESGTINSDASDGDDEHDADADGDGAADGVECPAASCPDLDSDEIPDHLDAASAGPGPGDSDDDGHGDEIECPTGYPCADTDGDAAPDYADTDSDGDGALDTSDSDRLDPCLPSASSVACDTGDTDGDGVPNGTDGAPTDPCLPDADAVACATGDADDDGAPNGTDGAPTDPCLPDADAVACATGDADDDGVPNGTDSAPTDPCLPDADALACATGDADDDGAPNGTDSAPTDPCLPDADALACATGDTDADGVPNGTDSAPSNPCLPSADVPACTNGDDDGDGTPNGTDSAPTDPCVPDADALACTSGDADDDGVDNGSDSAPADPCVPNADALACEDGDTDGDGVDNDGDSRPQDPCVPNANGLACEGGDADDDGVDNGVDTAPADPCVPNADALACDGGDADGDGVDNEDDASPDDPCVPSKDALACDSGDTDDDGVANGEDRSPDDPCAPDADALACGSGDADGDGVTNADDDAPDDPCLPDASADACDDPEPEPADRDQDDDGVSDAVECPGKPCRDTDQDGKPDLSDPDDDGDGIATRSERGDENRDGVRDYLQPYGTFSGGAGCSAQPRTHGGFATLGLLMLLGVSLQVRRSRRTQRRSARRSEGKRGAPQLAALLCLIASVCAATPARAQVALEQFKPAPLASDGFALSRPSVLDGGSWDLMVTFDYANDPLVLETRVNGEDEEERVVEHHLVAHVGAGVAIAERVGLFASLPVHLLMKGDDLSSPALEPEGAGIGDLSLGARALIVGEADDAAALGFEFIARLPTADLANDEQQYSGDEVGSYEPALLGELRMGVLSVQLRGGVRLRKKVTLGELELGPEFVFGAGLRLKVAGEFYLHGEFYGSTHLTDPFDKQHTPVELLAGPKLRAGAVVLGAAAGPGLVRGYGSPDVRVVATLGVAPIPEEPGEQPTQADIAPDMDGDGLVDTVDRCPREAEDKDEFEDDDGCPDPDNDGDGVNDPADRCPSEAEDKDGFEDDDGCIDSDNDKDQLLDADDQCPNEAEDADSFKDSDGCPDPDNDGDGVPDTSDDCPLAPGSADARGCPKSVRFDAEKGEITILDRVEFATGKDTLLPSSFPILQEVQNTLEVNPQVMRLRVEGHTDSVGRDSKNLDLSKRRARSVALWLIERGTANDRLEAWGCGETLPIADNKTKDGKQQNRRVEFHVVDPSPRTPRPSGCEPLAL